MRSLRKILAVAVLAAVPVAALAAPAESAANKAKSPVTVADFAAMLAASRGIETGPSAEVLASAGVPLGDLDAPLTEGRLAEILKHYGVEALTANPAATVSRGRAESSLVLANVAGLGSLSASISPGPGPSTLDDCLAMSKNHGFCVNCCKSLPGDPPIPANACTRFCSSFTGKPSVSEPLP